MNYLQSAGTEFHADAALFSLDENEYGFNAYTHPRPEVLPVSDRLYELSLGKGAVELFALDADRTAHALYDPFSTDSLAA